MSSSSDAILQAAAVPPDECGDSMADSVLLLVTPLAPMPLPLLKLTSSVFGIVLQLFG